MSVLFNHARRWRHQDTVVGARCSNGQGVDPLPARMARAKAIRQAHGFRVAPCGEESRSGHTGWTSLGLAQPPAQLVELVGEQGERKPEDCTGHRIMGHSRIQSTLDLYTDEDLDEMIAAQEKFLNAVGLESGRVQ